jgi:uncharacterized protein YceK
MRPHNTVVSGALVVILIACLVLSGCAALQTATRASDTPNHLFLAFPGEAHAVSAQTNVCRYSAFTALVSSGGLEGIDMACAARHHPPPFRSVDRAQAATG